MYVLGPVTVAARAPASAPARTAAPAAARETAARETDAPGIADPGTGPGKFWNPYSYIIVFPLYPNPVRSVHQNFILQVSISRHFSHHSLCDHVTFTKSIQFFESTSKHISKVLLESVLLQFFNVYI